MNKPIDSNNDKVIIFIKSRLREDDVSGCLSDIEGFDILNLDLPLVYTGELSSDKWKHIK